VDGEVGVFGPDGRLGGFGELLGEPPWPRAGSSETAATGGFVVSGAGAGQCGEVPRCREQAHVQAALGDQDLGGVRLDAGHREQQLDDLGAGSGRTSGGG
jgi:hypothetical protein